MEGNRDRPHVKQESAGSHTNVIITLCNTQYKIKDEYIIEVGARILSDDTVKAFMDEALHLSNLTFEMRRRESATVECMVRLMRLMEKVSKKTVYVCRHNCSNRKSMILYFDGHYTGGLYKNEMLDTFDISFDENGQWDIKYDNSDVFLTISHRNGLFFECKCPNSAKKAYELQKFHEVLSKLTIGFEKSNVKISKEHERKARLCFDEGFTTFKFQHTRSVKSIGLAYKMACKLFQ